MHPFNHPSDYLQVVSHHTWENEGENFVNIRQEWHNLKDITFEDHFISINTGLDVYGSWKLDGGDSSLAPELKEKRAFCRKGKATFTFTGTSALLRIFVNPDYGEVDVRVDGMKPSEIPGVEVPMDVITCDSYAIPVTWGEDYFDPPFVSNLTNTLHIVELYAENEGTGVGDWFCVAGYKVSEYSNKTRNFGCWIVSEKISANKEVLQFQNTSGHFQPAGSTVYNFRASFDDYFIDAAGNPISLVEVPEIPYLDEAEISFYPDIQGTELESQVIKYFEVYAEYEDLLGPIHRRSGIKYINAIDETDYTTFGPWDMYEEDFCVGGSNPITAFIARGYNNGCYLEFEFFGQYISIECIKTEEHGIFSVYIDTIFVGILDPWGTCDVKVETFGGLPNTSHTLKLLITSPWGYIYFSRIWWEHNANYIGITEQIEYKYNLKHIPPFPSEDPRFKCPGDHDPTCDLVNLTQVDYDIPRTNDNVDMLYFDKRVATFAVCYQPGFEEILKTYDIVIVEPKALTRTIVKEFQDLGIKVICYVSYGEEVGTYENEWDTSSSLVPYTGDGLGPGGYASYYNKGGNHFGECSECKHDRRRLEEVVACAQGQGHYAVWAERCSNACTRDSRTGYESFSTGGTCGGGYSGANNWSRTATKACTNSACPLYNPVNSNCPLFESPDAEMFGQDFSMFTPDWPDENGIWKSFYTNPRQPTWDQRLRDYYLPTIFEEGVEYVENKVVEAHLDDLGGTVEGFKVENIPIDSGETIQVKNIALSYVYTINTDYLVDLELGVFKMQVSSTGAPPAPVGTDIEVTYTRKGLCADGIFLDTLDTVDVYSSPEYQQAMVNLIGGNNAKYSKKIWAMNRGFTILEGLMPYTDYVMFETFVTSYNWDTGQYYEITNPAALAANQVFIDQLYSLRENYVFNVFGLNYCDKNDDVLKQLIAEKTRVHGWLSWSSEIALNNPQSNEEILTEGLPIETNAWRLVDEHPLP